MQAVCLSKTLGFTYQTTQFYEAEVFCVCVCVCVCVYLYICIYIYIYMGPRGGVVVKAPRYKPVGREFDSPWCHWNFSVTLSFRSHYGPGIDSASNRNAYQVYFLGVKAAGA